MRETRGTPDRNRLESWLARPWWLAAALACSAPACAAETGAGAEEVTAAPGALSVALEQPAPGNVDIDAARDAVRVHLELRRGALRPSAWIGNPVEEGRFEGDVLVADASDRVVLAEVGGHAPVDASWVARMEQPAGQIDFALRRQELELAAEVAGSLETDARLDAESRILIRGLTPSIRATLAGYDEGPGVVAEAEPSEAPSGVHAVAPGETGTVEKAALYVHQIYIRRAVCCWNTNDHSATRLRIFNSAGGLLADVKTRNHGRWVDDPSMSTAAGCPRSWSGRTNQAPFFAPWKPTDTFLNGQAGGCPTSYGPAGSQHVCTDDSYAQYNFVKSNPLLLPNLPPTTCSDGTLRVASPTCN